MRLGSRERAGYTLSSGETARLPSERDALSAAPLLVGARLYRHAAIAVQALWLYKNHTGARL